jgi:hypothetical protein
LLTIPLDKLDVQEGEFWAHLAPMAADLTRAAELAHQARGERSGHEIADVENAQPA